MCDCDAPSAYREYTRKARKEHRCCECRGVIARGDQYEYVSGIWDGDARSFKTCMPCAEERRFYVSQLHGHDCGPCFGELYLDYPPNELPPHVAAIRNAA